MNEIWRFIDSGSNDGNYNMAFDENLLKTYKKGEPVFRLYEWNPPAISLGRFQDDRKVLNLSECRRQNINIVQRISGGGAIFHDCDISYSIVCDDETIGSLSVKDSYFKLCNFLVLTYKEIGLNAAFSGKNNCRYTEYKKSDFCFAGWNECDIIIKNGVKIGGNAQRRLKNIIFQHGSIPIKLNIEKIKKCFNRHFDSSGIMSLDLLSDISLEKFKSIMKKNFKKAMNIENFKTI